MFLHPSSNGAARNAREGRCSQCHRRRLVFERDGVGQTICQTCLRNVVDEIGATLDEPYEGYSGRAWLVVHDRHRGDPKIGCPWCCLGMVA